jgi:hypothetical protein
MPNVIVEVSHEIARVRNLLARFDSATHDRAQRTIAAAEYALAMNHFELLREAIEDLKEFTIADPSAPAPEGEK